MRNDRFLGSVGKRPFWPSLIGLLISMVLLSIWAGFPTDRSVTTFGLGILLYLLVFAGFGAMFWHLMIRPLPPRISPVRPTPLSTPTVHLLAILLGGSAFAVQIGGFWDEVWHRQYGVGFGDDLFWPPHIAMYLAFATVVIIGLLCLAYLLRRGRGSLQQRFRANPFIGYLALFSGLLLYSLPSDPIWHLIYGEDITAWSLPHLALLFNMFVISYVAAGIRLSLARQQPWGRLKLSSTNLFIILLVSFTNMFLLQVLVSEWDALFTNGRTVEQLAYWNRPDWILPVVLLGTAAFLGNSINRLTNSYGAATLLGIVTLLFRLLLIEAFQFEPLRATSWFLLLPLLVGLDAWTAVQGSRSWSGSAWASGGVLVLVGLVTTFPLINHVYTYPTIDLPLLLWLLPIGYGTAVFWGWVGDRVGAALSRTPYAAHERDLHPGWLIAAPATMLALGLVFVVMILTATPPV